MGHSSAGWLVGRVVLGLLIAIVPGDLLAQESRPVVVDASSLRGKVLCGYQGWFRCPGDAAEMGWIHWSRDPRRIAPGTLTFEMWPDLTDFEPAERFAVPGFTHPDGRPAELFSSDHPGTVLRHFEWMREHAIDGVWLQHFVVDLPGGPAESRHASRLRVLDHVRKAASQTGRTWAITFDISGMPPARTFEVLAREWRRLVDQGVTRDPRYLHHEGRPVVQVWGYYRRPGNNLMPPDLATRLSRLFQTAGPYAAFLVGGGDWDWRNHPDPDFTATVRGLDGYAPWNVANYSNDAKGNRHASMAYWAEDQRDCERRGKLWLPVVYPGFAWTNLKGQGASAQTIPETAAGSSGNNSTSWRSWASIPPSWRCSTRSTKGQPSSRSQARPPPRPTSRVTKDFPPTGI